MLPSKIAFVDIETTGMRTSYDRIIEIGILRIENDKLVKTFSSLINPQTHLPKEITNLTGINGDDLENAPTFRSVKEEILELLNGATFVAHNVRFDYGFVKHELMRENHTFSSKHFCTVRLSRILYPGWARHNLDAVIQNCNITCTNRHRAFDDAKVLYEFYNYMRKTLPVETIETALAKTMKKPSLPIKLPFEMIEKLPEKPGVYIFYGADDGNNKTLEKTKFKTKNLIPLYVGKSVNIKNRVLSHFADDIHSSTEMKIAQQIESIDTITTAGELGALFLESQMIKELLPIYNKMSRVKHELIAMKSTLNKHGYYECSIEPISKITPVGLENFLGFYRSKKQAKAYLMDIAKNFSLCEKLLGLEKTMSSCFAHRLGRCYGACIQLENPAVYNLRFLTAVSGQKLLPWPYAGPITIQEEDIHGKKEYFIIDNWCYIGKITTDTEGTMNDTYEDEVVFDLDMYKILRTFLKNPANHKKIANAPKQIRESAY